MDSRLVSRKLLGVILLLFFLVYAACGIPLNEVYVDDFSIEISIRTKTIMLNPPDYFIDNDNPPFYDKRGYNIYYLYANSESLNYTPNNNNSNLYLCYNTNSELSSKPLIPIEKDSINNNVIHNYEIINNNTFALYSTNESEKTILTRNNTKTFSNLDTDDSDLSQEIDLNEDVFVHFFIEYYAERDFDGDKDETEPLKKIESFKIEPQ